MGAEGVSRRLSCELMRGWGNYVAAWESGEGVMACMGRWKVRLSWWSSDQVAEEVAAVVDGGRERAVHRGERE